MESNNLIRKTKGSLKIIFILALSIIPANSFTQNIQISKPHKLFSTFEPGFGTLTNGIIQDSDGFFWLGSNRGLNQWDGLTIKRFTHSNSELKNISFVNCIYEDRSGIIWLGTQSGGLFEYNKKTGIFIGYTHDPNNASSISSDNIGNLATGSLIIEDQQGHIWVGTNNGLNRFNPKTGKFTRFKHDPKIKDSIVNNIITALCITKNQIIWVGTQSGLCQYNAKEQNFIHYIHNPNEKTSISHNTINAIIEDKTSTIWIATPLGLNRFNKTQNNFKRFINDPDDKTSLVENAVNSLLEDNEGIIWMTHYPKNKGVSILNPKTELFYNYLPGISSYTIADNGSKNVYKDKTGTIWISSISGSLSKLIKNKKYFTSYNFNPENPSGLKSRAVVGMIEDSNKNIWILSEDIDGLQLFNREKNTFKKIKTNNKILFSSGTWCKDGSFWISDTEGMLYQYDLRNHKSKRQYKITSSFITSIREDSDSPKTLWLTTMLDGLVKVNYETNDIKYYKHVDQDPTSLNNNQIWASVFQDDKYSKLLWVGTTNGINLFNKKTGKVIKVYKHKNDDPSSISSNTILNIMKTSKGQYWISTFNGLNKFDPLTETFKCYSPENKDFPANVIIAVYEDKLGNLWTAGVDKGNIIKFNPDTEIYQSYGKADGVDFGTPYAVGHFQSSKGELYFSGDNGFVVFNPSKIKTNQYEPEVFIFGLFQSGIPIKIPSAPERLDKLIIDWQHPYFEFEISVLNYTHPEKNQYQYFLKGWDHTWFEAGTNKRGRYSGLKSGTYTLKVLGTNNDKVWSRKSSELEVVVTTPFWASWWFRIGLIIFIFGIISFFVLRKIHLTRIRTKELEDKVHERTKELIIAKEKAEDANKAKSVFLANMSHELRTPLNAVLGYSEILYNNEEDNQKQKYLKSVRSSGKALLNLINDVLDLSRIEAGKFELFYASVSIHNMFHELSTMFKPKILAKDLEFDIKIAENTPPSLILDEIRLRQIIINLLSNATKFTNQGKIILSCHVPDRDEPMRSHVTLIIQVQDSGIGISKKDQERIFLAFEQAGEYKTNLYGGTGLGLSISRNIAQLMNGSLTAKSIPGQGSTFTITLPKVKVDFNNNLKEKTENEYNKDTINFEPATILIVDDIDYNRDVLATYLKPWKLSILFAGNGLEAIDQVKKNKPEIILMDMKMPKMDGYEASRIIKSHEHLSKIPIIAVTASALIQDEAFIRQTCDGYLRKPISRYDLIHELLRYLPHTIINKDKQRTNKTDQQHTLPDIKIIKKLFHIAKGGDMDEIQDYLNIIKKKDNNFNSFCNELKHMALKYQDQEIIVKLKEYIKKQEKNE